jgi:hypothetical protein
MMSRLALKVGSFLVTSGRTEYFVAVQVKRAETVCQDQNMS